MRPAAEAYLTGVRLAGPVPTGSLGGDGAIVTGGLVQAGARGSGSSTMKGTISVQVG